MMKKKLSLLGVASGLGQKHHGLEDAPRVLREHGLESLLSQYFEVKDLGNIPSGGDQWKLIDHVYESSLKALLNFQLLLTIGGDHSLSMGTVQASLKKYPKTKVLWIDAHGDINTPVTSLTGNLHGMPLAGLLNLFSMNKEKCIKLQPERLCLVGVRDLDPAEKTVLEELEIKNYSSEEVNLLPIAVLKKVHNWINDGSHDAVHLSLDVDSLDPSFAPATGTRVNKGLSLEFVNELVKIAANSGLLVSFDIVEMNPSMALSIGELETTIGSIMSIISTFSLSFKEREKDL